MFYFFTFFSIMIKVDNFLSISHVNCRQDKYRKMKKKKKNDSVNIYDLCYCQIGNSRIFAMVIYNV